MNGVCVGQRERDRQTDREREKQRERERERNRERERERQRELLCSHGIILAWVWDGPGAISK